MEPSGLLISHVGVAKIMGAPFRTFCPRKGMEGDKAWLAMRVSEQGMEVAKLLAHIRLKSRNELMHSLGLALKGGCVRRNQRRDL